MRGRFLTKIGKGLATGAIDGSLGTELTQLFDQDGDGKVSLQEALDVKFIKSRLKTLSIGQVVKLLVSLGTTAMTIISFIR